MEPAPVLRSLTSSLRKRLSPSSPLRSMQATTPSKRFYSAPVDGSIPAAKQKYVPTEGTYPKGFRVAGVHVGVKASNTRFPDVALIESDAADSSSCAAAAVFTKSRFAAAPVVVDRTVLEKTGGQGVRSVLINSGCANAVTGQGGLDDAWAMAREVERTRESSTSSTNDENSTLVMSTGVIGQRLPINKILGGVPAARSALGATHAHWLGTARAICTTDTFPKLRSTTFTLPSTGTGVTYALAGISKGAGMIHPNMATLLGVMCTDAPIAAGALKPLLTYAADRSFNAISVDGDTSTNDTLALLANGAAAGESGQLVDDVNSPDALAFRDVLTDFARQLAHLVVRDGEGATKFVHVRVTGARSYDEAFSVAKHIAVSPLVKTALYAEDANWGRVLAKAGTVPGLDGGAGNDGALDPARTSLSFVPADGSEELVLLRDGEPTPNLDEERAKQVLAFEDLEIKLDLGVGGEEASFWTCDFSHEYVTINADYRT